MEGRWSKKQVWQEVTYPQEAARHTVGGALVDVPPPSAEREEDTGGSYHRPAWEDS